MENSQIPLIKPKIKNRPTEMTKILVKILFYFFSTRPNKILFMIFISNVLGKEDQK
jgi:hypothetical protein